MANPIRRALLSVSDKSGIVDLARALAARGVALISTGGTRRVLLDAGLAVADVSEVTEMPEMMDGRVKTLHPRIHGGLLAIREDDDHRKAMASHGIEAIDLLVVNLYPFEATLARGAPFEALIEDIDIGGPAMIRAAAKNHADVTVLVDGADYLDVLAEMDETGGATTAALRRRLAAKAFARTAAYDAAIANWFQAQIEDERAPDVPRRRRRPGRGPALRREPASVGCLLPDGGDPPGRGDRAAGAGQGALLQQPQRHGRGL